MMYINGDNNNKFSLKEGCIDKTPPVDIKKYIFNCPIYFACYSNRWNGGFAFLDYENSGTCYGKIYKIKLNQFLDLLNQEQRCILYDTILLVDYIDYIPVLTFTANHKLNNLLNNPSKEYINVMINGLNELYNNIDFNNYFKNN